MHTSYRHTSYRLILRWSALLAFLLIAPLAAQMPADSVLRDFEPNDDFGFFLGGEPVPHTEIFHSKRAGAYLIMAPSLDTPLLLNVRTAAVESVHLMKVARRPTGTVDLLADAVTEMVTGFTLQGRDVIFKLDGKTAKLQEKPPLTGLRTGEEMKNHSASYTFKSKAYGTDAAQITALRAGTRNVRLRVYFGTWCPVCSRLLPNVLKIEEELAGSKIRFEYYGLPKDMHSDPETDRASITGVPTAVVFVGDQEVGRLTGNELHQPETALRRLLDAS